MSELVYLRDASWLNRPDVRAPKKYHRAAEQDPGTPACRPGQMVLNEETGRAVGDVAAATLCRRCFPGVGAKEQGAGHDEQLRPEGD